MGQDERGGAMMTKEQIITGIIDCLDHQLHGGMGHMQDKYYKGEFFRHCSRDPGFDMDMASDHFYTAGSNRFSRGGNDVWTG